MSQPPTAAIVIAGIVGGAAAIFVSYKVYVRWHHRQQQRKADLPPIREPQDYSSQYLAPQTNAMAGTLYGGGDQYGRDSWRTGSHSRGSFNSHADRKYGSEASLPYHNPRRSSSQGLLLQSSTPVPYSNEVPSPTSPMSPVLPESPAILPRPASVLDAYEASQRQQQQPVQQLSPPLQQHGKMLSSSSSSSTMTINRNYASSTRTSPGLAASIPGSTYRRDTYLPHLPENRDQIQIVPPQPLGFGLGGMATAIDQKTLAFSSTSGIGIGDDFSKGLVWQEGQPPDAPTAAGSSSHPLQHRNSKLAEEERLRYLAQGPRTMSPAMRGAVHNHLYAGSNAGSSGMRTPEIPSSRSRSPAPIAPWDGSSTSDVGPSVSQRGAVSPSEHPLQHLEASPLIPSNMSTPQYNRNGAFMTSQQSPLAMMSGVTTEDVLAMQQQNPEGGLQKDGPSITSSPILGAFRNPASPRQQAAVSRTPSDLPTHSHSNSQNSGSSAGVGIDLSGERTPGLVEGSVSTENGSATALRTDSSGRQSVNEVRIGGEGLLESLLPPAEIKESNMISTYGTHLEKRGDIEEGVALETLPNVGENEDAIAITDTPLSPSISKDNAPTSPRSRGWLFGRKKVKSPV